jgi:hypothetical protein
MTGDSETLEAITKVCTKCGAAKARSCFYAHGSTSDRLDPRCKACAKALLEANRRSKRGQYNAKIRERRRANPDSRESMRAAIERWDARNPHKNNAKAKVRWAVKQGRIVKAPCEVCGATNVHGHHDDYTRPLDVKWLCPFHHKQRHAFLRTQMGGANG